MTCVGGCGGSGGTCVCVVGCWMCFIVGFGYFWFSFLPLASFVVDMCGVGVFDSTGFVGWLLVLLDHFLGLGLQGVSVFCLGGSHSGDGLRLGGSLSWSSYVGCLSRSFRVSRVRCSLSIPSVCAGFILPCCTFA